MNWKDWQPYYQEVMTLLGLDIQTDLDSASRYLELVKQARPRGYENSLLRITNQKIERIWVFGAGPSLPTDFRIFDLNYNKDRDLIIAADGATTFLLQKKVLPAVVFSDYDGDLKALHHSCHEGSLLVLHAHGDNFNIVQEQFYLFEKESQGFLLPTIQTEPIFSYLFNFGGFTDGDRCIAASLDWFPKTKIGLIGFTFGSVQGRFSKPYLTRDIPASSFKFKKLQFAKYFIETYLIKQFPNQIWNFSSPTDSIKGIRQDLANFIR